MKIPNFKTEAGSNQYKDTVGRLIAPRVAEVLLENIGSHLENPLCKTILDLGCGPGTLTFQIANNFPQMKLTGVDSSESMITLAKSAVDKQGLKNVQFNQMEADHISFDPATFDLVLCNLAFPFFPKPHESMRGIFSVVRPGGTVHFTVPGRQTWNEFFEVASSVAGNMVSMARPFLSKFSQSEVLPEALSAAGFINITEKRVLLPFEFANGQSVLEFFAGLFSLMNHAPIHLKSELSAAIDRSYQEGFTMHYEAVIYSADRSK